MIGRRGAVVDEGGEAHRGIEAIVGNDDGVAAGGERLGHEQVVVLAAGIPRAAVEEDHRPAVGTRLVGPVEIELLAGIAAVGDVRVARKTLARDRGVEQRGRRAAAEQTREAGEEAAPGHGHVAAMSRTCSASASEAVRPGDSMPKRFMRPGTP